MFSIKHKVGIKASPEAIYRALTTNDGLKSWWTDDVIGAGEAGAILKFRFNGGGPDFKVSELLVNKLVCWEHCGDMPQAWVGTEITFRLDETEVQTFVHFTHGKWKESSDFMAHCNTKWAVFLFSLKDAVESGQGRPFPNDIQIDYS